MEYYFKDKFFVIENYDKKATFASFLPGIAGKMGKPTWAYYVNRAQVISSFGVNDKNSPILEFSPASIAYQVVQTEGFRTFIKVNGQFFEPFCVSDDKDVERTMYINESSVSIVEKNKKYDLMVKVVYYGLPNESFCSLVRRVEITNIGSKDLEVEFLDGLTTIIPVGVSNDTYKAVGNLMRSWMDVDNLDHKIAFYKLRASSSDQAEVTEINNGHFFLSSVDGEFITPLVDATLLFGYDVSLSKPINFIEKGIEEISESRQITANKVPCGFVGGKKNLKTSAKFVINSMYGSVENIEVLNERINEFDANYFAIKEEEAYSEIRNLTNDVQTTTNYPMFDEYCRQSYLDNFIRGGYPTLLDDNKEGIVYYLYSRKHGDLERDYNWFNVAAEYYSQGNGNYRDANQNRRNDSLIKPYVKDFNIKMFMNLIQLDGYNPLSVNGVSFRIEESKKESLIKQIISGSDKGFGSLLQHFTPGRVVNFLAFKDVKLNFSLEETLKIVLSKATYDYEANFGEGYWSDHWTYNFDLIENYLSIYPDLEEELLFGNRDYKYFQSPISILPRSEKYVLNNKHEIRQYGAINHHNHEKQKLLGVQLNATNWLKTINKEIYQTNLFEKLFSLALIKFSSLDSFGIGIEMDGDKPGWNDAMNGIPGLFGSGVSETTELLRVTRYLLKIINNYHNLEIGILKETDEFSSKVLEKLEQFYHSKLTEFSYWDEVSTLKEQFRELTDLYVSGEVNLNPLSKYLHLVELMNTKLNDAINKALEVGQGIIPTYLTYEAKDYELVKDSQGANILTHYGLPKVKIKDFNLKMVPYFLEAPARSYKILDSISVKQMHEKIKKTDMYDKLLKIYRTSVDLDDQSLEMGRIRAFTKGWLERESCFLHMTYKYILGLLKSGLYEEFFEELKTNLVAFMNPEVYGRSTLENSSFIATSCNPDESTHGRGYVSRLTGANTEFLSIWQLMMFGKNVIRLENGQLVARFNPIIPGDFFNAEGILSATFMSSTRINYHNPQRKDTYKNCHIEKIVVDGLVFECSMLSGEIVLKLRQGSLKNIDIYII